MGRRAARHLVQEWPTLFMFDRDQPRLPAFRPEKPLDPDHVEINEQNLKVMVEERHVTNAIKLYERIKSEGMEITMQSKVIKHLL